jgi:hypothetical protein
MNTIRNSLTLVCTSLLLGACASVPTTAPAYRREAPALGNLVNVYIYRVGAFPKLRTPTVYVDEKEVFDPPEQAYTAIRLSPGKHTVATKWGWDSGAPNLSFVIDVPQAPSYYLKLTGDFKAQGLAFRTTSRARNIEEEVAEAELYNCCKYIANRFQY